MAYEQMANLYDVFMEDAPYDKWVRLSEEIFNKYKKQVKHIADLGCGTGEITIRLAQKGYSVIGVDYSADMLTLADQKASENQLTIQWLNQNITTLQGLEDLDAVVSFCDVINYITDVNDLGKAFKNVAASLKTGGLFLFDIHSMFHVQHNLIGKTFADVTENSSYIWFCSQGNQEGEMYHDLTFYMQEEDKYIRFDEYHHQKTHPIEFYQKLLSEAGLSIQAIFNDFEITNNQTETDGERIFFVAEKRSE